MNLPENVIFIINRLRENGHEAYVVGGAVRNYFIGAKPKDYDITTSALPSEVKTLFNRVIPTGEKHGTVTVLLDGESFEVTTFRRDGEYSDGRRPDSVEFTKSLREDLARRDFTMNAIAYNGTHFIDPFDGFGDMASGIIRAVGDPCQRFEEDALRMLRAIRFASQFNLSVSSETKKAITIKRHLIANVSAERIRDELCKIIVSDGVFNGFRTLMETNLLWDILPETAEGQGFYQHNPYHDHDVFWHTMVVLDVSPKDLVSRLAALLHDVAKPWTYTRDAEGIGHFYDHHTVGAEMSEKILRRLRFDNETIDRVVLLVREHMTRFDNPKKSTLKKFINRIGEENIEAFFALQRADIAGMDLKYRNSLLGNVNETYQSVQQILAEKQPLSLKDLAVNGTDLINELGLPPGKQIGVILKRLLELVLEHESLNNREELLEIAKRELL